MHTLLTYHFKLTSGGPPGPAAAGRQYGSKSRFRSSAHLYCACRMQCGVGNKHRSGLQKSLFRFRGDIRFCCQTCVVILRRLYSFFAVILSPLPVRQGECRLGHRYQRDILLFEWSGHPITVCKPKSYFEVERCWNTWRKEEEVEAPEGLIGGREIQLKIEGPSEFRHCESSQFISSCLAIDLKSWSTW